MLTAFFFRVLWEVQFMSLITQTASSVKDSTFGAENYNKL